MNCRWISTAALTCFLGAAGCDRAPAADKLSAWSPADHDQEPGKPSGNRAPKGSSSGTAAIVDVAWQKQCASCHGATGHGDGPQGPMNKASDLTRDDWQARVNDEEIAAVIKNGKGRMPKFDLPDDVVRALVSRVRSLRGK